ncbi:DUF305 domain-containing protein [Labrys okinawensis]|uniref:DUF305 domain-containing protein n=1 Tax=Labrys okinawensis TaxID=346911 RepID=UPI0039BC3DD3
MSNSSSFRPQLHRLATAGLAGALLLSLVSTLQAGTDEKPFLDANDAAMARMMAGMAAKPTGDVDRDFVAMMEPHHQGAIEMAQAELRYGSNEQLRRIAQEIIVEQQQEIAAMQLAINAPLPPSQPSPDQATPNQP